MRNKVFIALFVLSLCLFGFVAIEDSRDTYIEVDNDPNCGCYVKKGIHTVEWSAEKQITVDWWAMAFMPITHPAHQYRHHAYILWFNSDGQLIGFSSSGWKNNFDRHSFTAIPPEDAAKYKLSIYGEVGIAINDPHFYFEYNSSLYSVP